MAFIESMLHFGHLVIRSIESIAFVESEALCVGCVDRVYGSFGFIGRFGLSSLFSHFGYTLEWYP